MDTISDSIAKIMAGYAGPFETLVVIPALQEIADLEKRIISEFVAEVESDSSRVNFDELARLLKKIHRTRVFIEDRVRTSKENPLTGF